MSGRIELENDAALQLFEWRFQRLAWGIWALVLLAAAMGLLGPGPFSATVGADAESTISVAYDRFVRYQAATSIRVTANRVQGERIALRFSRDLIDRIEIERIAPEPIKSAIASDGIVYSFAAEASEGSEIVFDVKYSEIGLCHGSIQREGGGTVALSQFIYP